MWTILDTEWKKELTCWACLTDLNWPQPDPISKGNLLMRNPSGTGLLMRSACSALYKISDGLVDFKISYGQAIIRDVHSKHISQLDTHKDAPFIKYCHAWYPIVSWEWVLVLRSVMNPIHFRENASVYIPNCVFIFDVYKTTPMDALFESWFSLLAIE